MSDSTPNEAAVRNLREAFRRKEITLYLGSGVSAGNGLPSWEELVVSMYYSSMDLKESPYEWPDAAYLFAIAKWHLRQFSQQDLEVVARKVRLQAGDRFFSTLKRTLWGGFTDRGRKRIVAPRSQRLRVENRTLDEVAKLCEAAPGVRSVISYNFDSLLEMVLKRSTCSALWKVGMAPEHGRIPIYHVHGFVPIRHVGSEPHEIVFTEDQFHDAALNPLSWLNLVQLQALTGSTCLMVGMSLNDRNLRRLLEAVGRLPERRPHFAILRRTPWPEATSEVESYIKKEAAERRRRFPEGSGQDAAQPPASLPRLLREVHKLDHHYQTAVLEDLGIEPIWYDKYSEVPEILRSIRA